jgi:alpha-tubulin suppressor-like RCC1 family protein
MRPCTQSSILISLIFLVAAAIAAAQLEGTVIAWGTNTSGQCDVPEPNGGFVAVAAGWISSLGLKSDGTVVAWGDNTYVPSPNAGYVAISACGNGYSLLRDDGSVAAWGPFGSSVPEPNTGHIAVAAGFNHALVVRTAPTAAEGTCSRAIKALYR